MDLTVNLYLTDSSGKKYWNTVCGWGYHQGELANLRRRLANAKRGMYRFLDSATVRLVEVYPEVESVAMTDAEILSALGL